MAFLQQTFLGASIVSYTANVGWGLGNASQLQINLVEDPLNGDSFQPFRTGTPNIGQPVYFSFHGFTFSGILQKWQERLGKDGMPVFEVVVTDPREILDGAQVILNEYNGSTGGIYNLFNAFGYWEGNVGFGASLATAAGMPWSQIYTALMTMANQPGYSAYGGPLTYRGVKYGLDLSELPRPSAYYRITSVTANLLELIANICTDGGLDFFIELDGLTIKVKTVSRVSSAPLGTITAITNSNFGNSVVRSKNGLEGRNELTSAFLVGGNVTTLNLTESMTQFWGFDIFGNPITGVQNYLWFPTYWLDDSGAQHEDAFTWPIAILSPTQPANVDAEPPSIKAHGRFVYQQVVNDIFETMNLNASPVSDILGSVIYPCSTLEMRLAKSNYDTWSAYINSSRPNIAAIIGLRSPYAPPAQAIGQPGFNAIALGNDNPPNAIKMAEAAVQTDIANREQRMYQFVKGFADEYMGRKFLASVPFVLYETDPDTLQVRTSYEVTNGGYLPEGSSPLGLSSLNQDIFTLPDERFRAFCRFDNLTGLDLGSVSPQGTAVENNSLFMDVVVGTQIVYAPAPAVIVTLPGPVIAKAVDAIGNAKLISSIFQNQPDPFIDAVQHSYINMRISPQAQIPAAIAIPLQSNILMYGPWFAQGAAGKVQIDVDTTLTPWNFGGWDQMNTAGNIRVASAVTNMQVVETGEIELVGTPTVSLGETLQSGGPNLTGIDVQISTSGVTTTYRFATFTPKFGVFSKNDVKRMQRQSIAAMQLRREVRIALRKGAATADAVANADRSARAFMELAPAAFKRQSPHDVLVSYSQVNSAGDVLTIAQSATYTEAITLANANIDASFQATALMSLTGLLRPFCTQEGAGNGLLSAYTTPDEYIPSNVPSKTTLDPWKAKNDIEVYAWGNTYEGLHAYRRNGDFTNARAMALRGPLVVTGWGYAIDGTAVPGTGDYVFASGYLTNQQTWKTGPVDLLWNPHAGTWTCHDLLRGQLITPVLASSSGNMQVTTLNGAAWTQVVWNHFGTGVSGGLNVICSYISTDNRWYIVAADCTS